MADYYVSTTGSNTSPYDTWAKAATSPKTVVDYIEASGSAGNTIYIAAGTYSGADHRMYFDHANHNNLTINGAGRDLVIITSTVGHCLYVGAAVNVTVSGITFKDWPAGANGILLGNYNTILTVNNCDFIGINTQNVNIINNSGLTLNITNCRIFPNTATIPILYSGDADGAINNCSVMAGPSYKVRGYIDLNTTGIVNINNCLITDSNSHGIYIRNSGTCNIRNSIITSGNNTDAAYTILRCDTAEVNLYNNLLIACALNGDANWTSGTINTDSGNIKTNDYPKFKTAARRGYIIPTVDDGNDISFTHAQTIAAKLAEYGMKGTYFLEQTGWVSGNTVELRQMVADGHLEVAIHSYSHSAMTATGKIWDIVGGTLEINRTTDAITASTAPLDPITGFKAMTLAAIKTALEGKGLTVNATAVYGAATTAIHETARGECLNTAAALSTEVNILIDNTGASGFFKSEMADPKTWLADTIVNGAGNVVDGQTGLTYVCNSFGYPYNGASADSRLASIALGFVAARGNLPGEATFAYNQFLTDIDLYKTWIIYGNQLIGDGSESSIRYNARALGMAVAQSGLCCTFLTHTAADLTPIQLGYMLEEWQKFGTDLSVTSLQLYATAIRSRLTDDGDGTFSATGANAFTVNDGDYHPEPGSPLLRAGIAVTGITSDYDGNIVPLAGGYNIGPYNNQYVGGGSLSPGLGLSGGNRPPWWHRRRR